MATTGSRLQFPPTLILPLVTMLLGGYGLAFTMGSCALLFKRVQQVLGLFQFVLLFLLAVPTETWTGVLHWISLAVPMIPSVELLRSLMARGESLSLTQFAFALINGISYFVLGLALFRWAERQAKLRGLLSGY
jgi:ABC-2 type transport system permease protein